MVYHNCQDVRALHIKDEWCWVITHLEGYYQMSRAPSLSHFGDEWRAAHIAVSAMTCKMTGNGAERK